jgi:hypothetical protein
VEKGRIARSGSDLDGKERSIETNAVPQILSPRRRKDSHHNQPHPGQGKAFTTARVIFQWE